MSSVIVCRIEPQVADGNRGWYLQTPSVFLEFPFATVGSPQAYYYSLGSYDDPDYYELVTSGSATSSTPIQIYETELPLLDNYSNVWVHYSLDNVSYQRTQVSVCTESPSAEGFTLEDLNEVTVVGDYAPANGFCTVTGFRGYTTEFTFLQRKFRTAEIRLYASGVLWASAFLPITVDLDQMDSILADTTVFFHNRSQRTGSMSVSHNTDFSAYERALLGEFGGYLDTDGGSFGKIGQDFRIEVEDGTKAQGELAYTYTLKVAYEPRDFPLTSDSFFVEVENEAGKILRTTSVETTVVSTVPLLDRLGISKSALEGSFEVIGNFAHVVDLQTAEFTRDRRLPLLCANFIDGLTVTQDGDRPEVLTGVAKSTLSPFTGLSQTHKSISVGSTTRLAYPNRLFNYTGGTVEFWVAPKTGTMVGSTYHLVDFARLDSSPQVDRFSLAYQTNILGWRVVATVIDAFGTSRSVYYQTDHELGTWPSTDGQFQHVKFSWVFNALEESFMELRYNGLQSVNSVLSDQSIVFGVLPSFDYQALSYGDIHTQSGLFSPVYVGGSFQNTNTNCQGSYADLRILDAPAKDSQWQSTAPSGWSSTGTTLTGTTGMFKIPLSAPAADSYSVLHVRGTDIVGNKPRSGKFNTASGRPILVRGKNSGTQHGAELVQRFALVDSQGVFSDLRFQVNPSSYSFEDSSSRFNLVSSISGKQLVTVAPRQVESRTFNWTQLKREFLEDLIERSDSGNSFFLIDHNDEVLFGKFAVEQVSEITSTVPSRYEVTCSLRGQGGFYDYRMD